MYEYVYELYCRHVSYYYPRSVENDVKCLIANETNTRRETNKIFILKIVVF